MGKDNRHGPSLPDFRHTKFEPSAANGVTLREARVNEKLRHGKNAFTVGGSDYRIIQTILNGGMGIVYRAEKERGEGPEKVIIKQSSFVIDEGLVTAPDTVEAFVSHWQKNSPRIRNQKLRAQALTQYVIDAIKDEDLSKFVHQHISGKDNVAQVTEGLKKFCTSAVAKELKQKLERMQAEYVREYAILRFLQDNKVDHVPHVYDTMVRMKTPSSTEQHPLYNYYFAQEEAKGTSLFNYFDRGGRLIEEEIVRITLSLAKTLEHMHELGIVHRDVTYNNVFIYRNEQHKLDLSLLIDYGTAVVPHYEKAKEQTPAFTALSQNPELIKRGLKPHDFVGMGTDGFLAPEVATKLTRAADTFALGRLLFFMLTAQHPAGTPEEFSRQLGKALFNPHLKKIIREATDPVYSRRPYMDEIVDALEDYIKPQTPASRRP